MQGWSKAVLLACCVMSVGCTTSRETVVVYEPTIVERTRAGDVSYIADQDPEMIRAVGFARSSLDQFLALQASPPDYLTGFAVKVGVTDAGRTEYFWLNGLHRSGDGYEAYINNHPRLVRNVYAGMPYRFKREDIIDWLYVDRIATRTHGNFTGCALLAHEPAMDAAQFRREYGLQCY